VERPHVLVEEKCHVEKAPYVIDIVKPTFKLLQDAPISKDFIEEEMHVRSLLSLPYLLARCTQGKEPLVDYSQSHIMTSTNYLSVLQKKTIDKASIDNSREARVKEKEEKQARKASNA
jgi:hypothetical protein